MGVSAALRRFAFAVPTAFPVLGLGGGPVWRDYLRGNPVRLTRAPHDAETTLIVPCDLNAIATMRQNWPFLRDRRIDVYGALTARYLDHAS